jgi:hypothetical protein
MINRTQRLFAVSFFALSFADIAAASPDCSKGPIPSTPVSGTVGGKPFVPNDVTIHATRNGFGMNGTNFDTYELSIQSGGIFNAFTAHFLVPSGAHVDGRTFRVLLTDSISAQPAVLEGVPEVQGWDLQLEAANVDTDFTQDIASMRIEVGHRRGGTIPGGVIVCVPSSKSSIAGTFNARIVP